MPDSEGGFVDKLCAPSAIPWAKELSNPKELTIPEIKSLIQKFADAAKRAVDAGFDVIEVTK